MTRLRLGALLAAAAVGLLGAPIAAHEIGVVEVDAVVSTDGTFRVDVPVDPLSTLQRLQVATGEPLTPEPTEAEARAGIATRAAAVRASVAVLFDGVAATPEVAYVPRPPLPTGPVGLLRLTGRVPAGARSLRVRNDLVYSRYALTVRVPGSAEPTVTWLEGGETSPAYPLSPLSGVHPVSRLATACRYVGLGYTHIVPHGLDHILFVLGIFLLSTRWRPLLSQVTAFTVAHSITLGLSLYGVVVLPPGVVEPLIALSIVYVAVENLLTRRLGPWRIAVVFGFGLLHGLGFAGVLARLGLPRPELGPALLGFNVGVELGQLTVLAAAFVLVASWGRRHEWYRRRVVLPASLAIAAVGLLWAAERALS